MAYLLDAGLLPTMIDSSLCFYSAENIKHSSASIWMRTLYELLLSIFGQAIEGSVVVADVEAMQDPSQGFYNNLYSVGAGTIIALESYSPGTKIAENKKNQPLPEIHRWSYVVWTVWADAAG